MHIARIALALVALSASLAAPCRADTLQVGPSRTYQTVRAAILAAQNGDVIEIDAGTYIGDVATITADDLTIRGVGGFAHLDANGEDEAGKGIWVAVGDDLVVENVEFSGATVPDENGAGIRLEGANLTLRGCYFHDNESGVLAGNNASSDILIENSEFRNNGLGDGYTHNIYVNHVRSLTVRGSFFHHAKIGHELKSRANATTLYANRFSNDGDGTASYEIDLPDGGLAIIVGNVIQQASTTDNPTLLSYAAESTSNPMQAVYVVNNTFVNERAAGGTFVRIVGTPTAVLRNNLFVGPGTVLNGAAIQAGNLQTDAPLFVDRAGFDYRLAEGSPAIDMGIAPGSAGSTSLVPALHYAFPLGTAARSEVGTALDIGAFEFGDAPEPGDGGVPVVDPPAGGGCGCRADASPAAPRAFFFLAALGALVARGRRRRM
jgi:MYXO-CTERM domain-containing protein